MAASVQVLCPNGRRQTVKITPNTKLLQILEEVCNRQGFIPPEDFKLVQGRKELDLSLSVRFSSLPNNAKLELAKSSTSRVIQDVTIALQLDSGQRLQDSFTPSVTLWDLLLHFEEKHGDHKGKLTNIQSKEEKSLHPVCIFMREEVIGEQALKATTLKKLALTSGKAIIRLLHRPVEERMIADICDKVEKDKVKQARLEEIAQRKKEAMDQDERESNLKASLGDTLSQVQEEENASTPIETESPQQQQPKKPHRQQQQQPLPPQESNVDGNWEEAMDVDRDDTLSSNSLSGVSSSRHRAPQTKTSGPHSNRPAHQTDHIEELRNLNIPGVEIFTPDDFSDLSPAEQAIARRLAERFLPHLQPPPSSQTSNITARPSHSRHLLDEQSDNAFLHFKFPEETKGSDLRSDQNSPSDRSHSSVNSSSGQSDNSPCERNVLVYDASESLPTSNQELPEDFFAVTQSDVRLLYRDLQNAVHKLEDQPLMTKTMKQAQAEAAYDHYERVIIRVHFPDKLVLQAFFRPRETVQALHTFVKDCLQERNLKFYLYTTPPKTILNDMKSSLAVNHLAPAALVYYGCHQEREHYIKKDLLDTLKSRSEAETFVAEVLQHESRDSSSNVRSGSSSNSSTNLYGAGPSGMSGRARSSQTTSSPSTLPSGAQVPKWLKLGKK